MANAILATDLNGGIGLNGRLPWNKSKEDFEWFRDNTNGHVVLMGSKTWTSLYNTPLFNRINIVISNNEVLGSPSQVLHGEINDIINFVEDSYKNLKTWIIGGANIYEQSWSHVDKVYLTTFKNTYTADTFVDRPRILEEFSNIEFEADHQNIMFQIRSR